MPPKKDLHVGLVGAGLGGLAAAISLARAGARVTILEAAAELGEIGAGIQMTPNVSRLLIRWGVADIIAEHLVQCDVIRMRRKDGKIVAYTELVPRTVRECGFPWWVVQRHHLHQGLAEGARRHGVNIILNARVTSINYSSSGPVEVKTYKDTSYVFDFVIGSDGLKSIVRSCLFPNIKPRAPTTNAAYRAVITYDEVFAKHPELEPLFGKKNSIDVWVGPKGYAISYPMSAGKDLNFVFSHHCSEKVEDIQESTTEELREFYKDWDGELVKVINMVESNKRWPLMVTGPLESWSNEQKNVVLMGDAAHSMVNHMAQGAATSMEDGAFLGTVIKEVVRGVITLKEAVELYEKKRMPRAWAKQQASFLSGVISFLDEGKSGMRDMSSEGELDGSTHERSWNIWGSPNTMPHVYHYDPESDANFAVVEYLQDKSARDPTKTHTKELEDKWMNWFLKDVNDSKSKL